MDFNALLSSAFDIHLTDEQNHLFAKYHDYLSSENKKMNLTAVEGKEDVYIRHFFDSLSLASVTDLSGKSLLDVGSGAGFPGIPLKIVEPSLKLTIVESRLKRVKFLKRLVAHLGMDDVTIIRGRAEDLNRYASYDIVTARGVAPLNILVEITMPWVKKGGLFIAMKSAGSDEEIKLAKKAVGVLGGKIKQIFSYHYEEVIDHVLVIIEKHKLSPPKYPRRYGKIKREPL